MPEESVLDDLVVGHVPIWTLGEIHYVHRGTSLLAL